MKYMLWENLKEPSNDLVFRLWDFQLVESEKTDILKDCQETLTTAGFFLVSVRLKTIHTVLGPNSHLTDI